MKKYILILVVYMYAIQPIFAQFNIIGNITDKENKESLKSVSIHINDLKISVETDINGNYKLSNLKKGTYLIEIQKDGYNTIVNQYDIVKDETLNFELTPSHKEMSQVVITGLSKSAINKNIPLIIKTLDNNYLNQTTATNLVDALKNVPGISQITTGAAISKPIIRGLGYNRIITLYNGIRQEGQQWGDEHGIEIDEFTVNRVEIIKGPGSLIYGSDGIGGVINFITKNTIPLNKVKTQFVTNYQTNQNLFSTSIVNSGNVNGLQWQIRGSAKQAGNFNNAADGKVYNTGFNEYNGSVFLGINKRWGHTHLLLNSFNTTINLPEGDRDSAGKFIFENKDGAIVTATKKDLKGFKVGFPHQDIFHKRVQFNSYFILKKGAINLDLGFQNNKRKEFANVADPKEIDLFFDLNTFNYNARYNLSKIQNWETSVGFSGMNQTNTNRGIEFLIPNYTLNDIGAFIFTQKTIHKFTLAGGFRLENRNIKSKKLILDTLGVETNSMDTINELKFNAINKNFSGQAGSIGLAYQVTNESTIKLNFSGGFRAPNIAELASNGRHEGTFRYEIGNQNLKPELNKQIDVAYLLNSQHITLEITPFANFISNFIYTKKLKDAFGNDIIFDPSDPAPAFEFKQANATLFGGEIYVDVHPHPLDWLHIANSFSYVNASQNNATDSTKFLPFTPAPKYRGELKAEFVKINNNIGNGYIYFALDHFFSQKNVYSAFGTETSTPAYSLLSAGVGGIVKLSKNKDLFSFQISAENLTNAIYQNHLSRLKYAPENIATGRNGIFNPGRNVSIKLWINF